MMPLYAVYPSILFPPRPRPVFWPWGRRLNEDLTSLAATYLEHHVNQVSPRKQNISGGVFMNCFLKHKTHWLATRAASQWVLCFSGSLPDVLIYLWLIIFFVSFSENKYDDDDDLWVVFIRSRHCHSNVWYHKLSCELVVHCRTFSRSWYVVWSWRSSCRKVSKPTRVSQMMIVFVSAIWRLQSLAFSALLTRVLINFMRQWNWYAWLM